MNKKLWTPVVLMLLILPLQSQIFFNGSVDLEMAAGGENSAFTSNGINNEFREPHLAIHQLNLFMFAEIGQDWFFNGRLQWDIWGTGQLNPLRVTLAMVSWEPQDLPVSATLGRFVNPFGLYPRRQLQSENAFVNAPLLYGYFLNVSDTRGYWPRSGDSGIYGASDVGLTTVYFGGYSTGAMLNWVIVPELLDVTAAATNAALASQQNYTNLNNAGGVLRIGFQPLIYWQQGISLSYGSFMREAQVNNRYDRLERFRQLLAGTDIILAYAYFELSAEAIYSRWEVPASNSAGFQVQTDGELIKYTLENYGAYVDLKIEPPFLPGSYVAGRFEKIVFERFDWPWQASREYGNPWDNDVSRWSVAAGYKLARNVLLKAAYSDQFFDDSGLDADDWTFRSILSVSM